MGSVPVNGASPKSTSATPCPSEPGSQAATNAALCACSASTTSGRPDTRTVTTGTPRSAMLRIVRRSSGCSSLSTSEAP
jgi:hypothetical protein